MSGFPVCLNRVIRPFENLTKKCQKMSRFQVFGIQIVIVVEFIQNSNLICLFCSILRLFWVNLEMRFIQIFSLKYWGKMKSQWIDEHFQIVISAWIICKQRRLAWPKHVNINCWLKYWPRSQHTGLNSSRDELEVVFINSWSWKWGIVPHCTTHRTSKMGEQNVVYWE